MEANAISAGALCAPERFKELLWFIQSLSMTPRGLENFAESLIRDYPVRFISEAIGKIGVPENGK
ncbi:MAG TPA: hypothetical protein VFB72_16650, partial [Verrucomicrobiae bacterium]|nr:hypothetical protein [Verrucomicrobiae bacterium]